MVMELHVLGPAFGLPSIDAECLAAIIYLAKVLPTPQKEIDPKQNAHRQGETERKTRTRRQWRLIACGTPLANPFRKLPALRVPEEEDLWVAGYHEIVSYLRESSYGEMDLDSGLSETQQADSEAFTAFIRSRGGPLLDLSLYVSSENYTTCTRSALGEMLSWPESWTIPHELREKARKRSEHLGLSALDINVVRRQQNEKENQGLAAHIPASLRRPKQTVSGLLGKTAQHTQFRIDAILEDFLDPLHEQLDTRGGFLGEQIHAVDCLAIAYLTLMSQPTLPQDWLQRTLNNKYGTLAQWASKHATEIFGAPVSASDAICGRSTGSTLPWTLPIERTKIEVGMAVLECVVGAIPGLRTGLPHSEVRASVGEDRQQFRDRQQTYAVLRRKEQVYSQAVTSVLATSSLVAWLLYSGILSFPSRHTSSSRRNFGEAGALLGLR